MIKFDESIQAIPAQQTNISHRSIMTDECLPNAFGIHREDLERNIFMIANWLCIESFTHKYDGYEHDEWDIDPEGENEQAYIDKLKSMRQEYKTWEAQVYKTLKSWKLIKFVMPDSFYPDCTQEGFYLRPCTKEITSIGGYTLSPDALSVLLSLYALEFENECSTRVNGMPSCELKMMAQSTLKQYAATHCEAKTIKTLYRFDDFWEQKEYREIP